MGYPPGSPHSPRSQHCPQPSSSPPRPSATKKPSPSTELLCGADEIRTRAGVRFHIHVTPWHFVPSPRGTEVASPNLMLLSTIDNKKSPVLRLSFFAVRTRFELATSGVTGRHSNQLNYRTIWFWDCKCKSLL